MTGAPGGVDRVTRSRPPRLRVGRTGHHEEALRCPPAITPVVPNASAYIAQGGQQAANQMCGLAGSQTPFPASKLKELYKSKKNYVAMVEKRLNELEKQGWSLPVYHDLIMGDANRVNF